MAGVGWSVSANIRNSTVPTDFDAVSGSVLAPTYPKGQVAATSIEMRPKHGEVRANPGRQPEKNKASGEMHA